MREAGRGGGALACPRAAGALLVATDLDASLLDAASYRWDAARPALRALAERGARLVLCTSKTRSEAAVLAAELPAASPPALVVENGGALVVPAGDLERPAGGARRDGDDWVIELGVPRAALIASLRDIARETACAVEGFAELGTDQIARLTGLDPEAARRAAERGYDEPVRIEGDEDAVRRVAAAAARRGLRLVKGGRFHHLTGDTDKGRALNVLVDLHAAEGRRFTTIGLGDAPVDLSLLLAVQHPIIVPGPGGFDPVLTAALPTAERAPAPGPAGWNAAVLDLLARLDRTPLPLREPAAR
jgi:mannosyl-3-phosphoglycerate phosphatase